MLAGYGLSNAGVVMMTPSLVLLWSICRYPLAASIWGGFAVLISHSWLLALHPLTWVGINAALSLPFTLIIWTACAFLGGILVGFWAWFGKLIFGFVHKDGTLRIQFSYALVMACLWGLAEVSLARLPLFWIGLGSSLLPLDRPLAGLAQLFGAGGLATIQLLISWWIWKIFIAMRSGRKLFKPLLIGFSLVALLHLFGWSLLAGHKSSGSILVSTWQPAIPTRKKFTMEQLRLLPNALQTALEDSADLGADLFVAPEGTLPYGKVLPLPAPLPSFIGGFRSVKGQQRSSLLVFEKGEQIASSAIDKYRLVPLGEWVPSWPGLNKIGLSAVGGLTPGAPSRLLDWKGPPVGVGICYELSNGVSFSNAVSKGANWLLVVANLDPYPVSLHAQFNSLSQIRSIETARDLLVVANNGPSTLVSPNGEQVQLVDPFKEGNGLAKVHLYDSNTFYSKWGELPLYMFLVLGSFGIFFKG